MWLVNSILPDNQLIPRSVNPVRTTSLPHSIPVAAVPLQILRHPFLQRPRQRLGHLRQLSLLGRAGGRRSRAARLEARHFVRGGRVICKADVRRRQRSVVSGGTSW